MKRPRSTKYFFDWDQSFKCMKWDLTYNYSNQLDVNKNQVILSAQIKTMSRNNVFKLSGNMALGGGDNYPSNDFENIKNSLKLLKSKQTQKQSNGPLQSAVTHPYTQNIYSGSYSSNAPQRQPPVSKNFGAQDYQNYNYQQSQPSRNQANSYKDIYQPVEHHYPSNDYPPKQRNNARQEYQQYQPIERTKMQPKTQKQDYRQQPEYKPQRGQQRGGNTFEEKNIKELNRENRVQIQEYDPSEFVQCSQGCGRKFNPDSISKHEAICRKVFQQKRKEFNAQDQRLIANEQKKLMKKGQQVQKKIQEKKAKEKIPKWKAQSLQLRAGVKQNRNSDYAPTKEQQKILDQARNIGMVKCQFCGRSFNQTAAVKHIPFCESQQKKNQIRRR